MDKTTKHIIHFLSVKERRFIYLIMKHFNRLRWIDFVLVMMFVVGSTLFSTWYLSKHLTERMAEKIEGMNLLVDLEPLGILNVTQYSHLETGGKYTASSYLLDPATDSGKTCAVSRDLWQKKLKQGDIIYIKEMNRFYVCNDTMADFNPKTKLPQRMWVDLYESDMSKVNAWGLKRMTVYKLRR